MSEIFGVISDKVSEKLLLTARQLHGHAAAPCSLNLLKFCEFLFATKPLPLQRSNRVVCNMRAYCNILTCQQETVFAFYHIWELCPDV